jgi:hypothetical protein
MLVKVDDLGRREGRLVEHIVMGIEENLYLMREYLKGQEK